MGFESKTERVWVTEQTPDIVMAALANTKEAMKYVAIPISA